MRTLLSTLFIVSILSCTAMQARGDTILLVFTPDTRTANPGDTVQFFGTLTNNTASTVFINGDSFTFAINGAVDDSPFLSGPASLGPNAASGLFEILDVAIPVGQSPGVYDGTFNVTGGMDTNASDLLAVAGFHVDVNGPAATPEPSSVMLAAFAFILLLAGKSLRQRRRVRSS
jgi:hypothetical protein